MPIFDQGYQHWKGPLSGHVWRWLTIARHGVRVQRNSRILRLLLLLAWVPALGLVGAMVLWGLVERHSEAVLAVIGQMLPPDVLHDPRAYRATVWTVAYSVFFKVELYVIMLLVTVAGPGLISQDLRFNALPLYFARPLSRLDYFLGKLGIIGALVASVAVGPALFAYVVGVCFCLDLSVVKDTYPVLLGSVAYGLVIAVSAGTLILALSSLTRRTLYVGITWAGLWLISASVGGILTAIHTESVQSQMWLEKYTRWLDEHPPPKGARIIWTRSSRGNWPSPAMKQNPNTHKWQLDGLRPEQEQDGDRWLQTMYSAQSHAWMKSRAEAASATKGDWRPLCSYVANMERMADLLLDTESAWVRVGSAVERGQRAAIEKRFGRAVRDLPEANPREMADHLVLQYPWWWSAAVLAGLLGLSSWILTRRVKSLDRLR